MSIQFAPFLSTPAGASLTQTNWRDLGISYALCGMAALLIKPGLSFWQQGMDLKTYLAWDGMIALDARDMVANHRQEFVLKSPYDGATIVLNLKQFFDLIEQLKPDLFLDVNSAVLEMAPLALLQDLGYHPNDGLWLKHEDQLLYASNRPAQDALQAKVYHRDGLLDLKNPIFSLDMTLLEASCACPTCRQSLTCGYLHYLTQSTPLLSYRFLMMHNLFWIKKSLSGIKNHLR